MEILENKKPFIILLFLFVLAQFSLLFFFTSKNSNTTTCISTCLQDCQCQQYSKKLIGHHSLDTALAEASTGNNKTVIIAIVNKAYVQGDRPMLDIFLNSFWLGQDTQLLINNLLIVAVDQTAYDRCRFLKLHCYKLETDGVDFGGEKVYMSDDFIKMMWRRTLLHGDVLKLGYNFIFTDTDILWLRNPFPRLSTHNATIDLQISTDHFNGDQWNQTNPINTGFYMIKSNNKTISLFDSWYAKKVNATGLKEQDVLNNMIHEGVFQDLKLKVNFLDTLYFSGFCEDSKDVRAVTTVHANCCRTITAKVEDLTAVIKDWKRFRRSTANETASFAWSKHMACIRSWKLRKPVTPRGH